MGFGNKNRPPRPASHTGRGEQRKHEQKLSARRALSCRFSPTTYFRSGRHTVKVIMKSFPFLHDCRMAAGRRNRYGMWFRNRRDETGRKRADAPPASIICQIVVFQRVMPYWRFFAFLFHAVRRAECVKKAGIRDFPRNRQRMFNTEWIEYCIVDRRRISLLNRVLIQTQETWNRFVYPRGKGLCSCMGSSSAAL